MSYAPISPVVFNAAYTGALGGIACNGSKPLDPNFLDYGVQAAIAGAWAQAVDEAWNSASGNLLDEFSITATSAAIFENMSLSPESLPAYQVPATWQELAKASVAITEA